jgi:hypothetical protein
LEECPADQVEDIEVSGTDSEATGDQLQQCDEEARQEEGVDGGDVVTQDGDA